MEKFPGAAATSTPAPAPAATPVSPTPTTSVPVSPPSTHAVCDEIVYSSYLYLFSGLIYR